MQILFYSSDTGRSERLSRFIEVLVTKEKVTYVHTHEALSQRLRHPVNNIAAAVLFICSKDDLLRIIIDLRDLLWDIRFILILPDMEQSTISMAHSLNARFIGYEDDDFLDIAEVLGRIVGKSYYIEELR